MFLNPDVSEEFFLVSIVFCFWFTFYVRIGSYSGSFSAQMRENTDQNNSEYGHFLPSVSCSQLMNAWSYRLKVFTNIISKII